MKIKFWLIVLTVVLFASPVSGQSDGMTPAGEVTDTETAVTPGYSLLDAALLEAFLDGTSNQIEEAKHLPGLTVSVVQNGELVLAKGYGLARTNPPQPVVAEETLFRIGSISKTFTFTAVMQLVEQDLLDLDADIESLVDDVRIEDRFGPITMLDLMSHSAGFEDAYFGFFYADNIETDLTADDYLNRYAPHRVRPPGEQIVYSNFGVNLAGKIVETVSGENFSDYTDKHIFEPLGMTRSGFRDYPNQAADGYLDAELEEDRAIGYRWEGGKFLPYDQFFMHRAQYPAGSVSATATDMAVFMLAHLNGGASDGKRVLSDSSVDQMHKRLRGNADGIQGNAHGFWTGQIRGYRTVEHGGAVLGFLSDMVLVPELGLGIFVSTNGDDGRGAVTSLPRRVIENFYPPLALPPQPDSAFTAQREVYAGQYLSNRRGYKIIDKLAALGSETTVSVTDNGYLITTSGQGSKRWLPLGDHVFENVDDGSRMAFEVNQSGVAVRWLVSYGHNVADRISLLNSSKFFYIAAGSTLVLAIGSLFGFWLRRGQQLKQTGGERLAASVVGFASLAWLLFFVAFVALFIGVLVPEPEVLVRYPTTLAWVMHLSAIVAATLAVVSTISLLPVWRDGNWRVWRQLRHTVMVLTGLLLVWVLNDWNVLGFRYLGA